MTQYVINIGSLPNDGTGDPLRTAFNETNLNFDQVFAAGPVLSNIRIANNTILTTNTNGNLVLAPNGIGRIQANATVVPSVANVRDLGSLTQRWNTVYTQNLNASGFITGQFGNITVAVGNLHISGGNNGYVLQTDGNGNLTWTAQTGGSGNAVPAGANTQVQFNNAGSFGADPDFYFNNTTNTLVVNGNLNQHSVELGNQGFTPLASNVIAQITGNANSYTQVNFQNINSGNRATTDYVATAAFGTDSTYYVNMGIAGDSYDNLNPNNSLGTSLFPQDSYLYAQGGNSVGGTGGNLVVGSNEPGGVVRVIADGSFAANVVATFSNAGVDVKGNVIPVTSNTYSLGNATNQWTDLWVSNNTIYMNSVPITLGAGNVLTVAGEPVLTNDSTTSIATTGNITADYFFGDGSQLTGISITSNALVNGDNAFVLNSDGNVVFEGETPGDGVNRGLVWDYGAVANGVNSTVRQDNSGLTVRAWTENGGGGTYAAPVNIVTNQDGNTNTWIFNGDGDSILPGNLILAEGNIRSNVINPAFNSAITGINSGNATVIITIADELFEGPFSGTVTISGVNPPVQANGDWWYQAVDIDQFQLYTDDTFTTPVDGTDWPGYVDGGTAVSAGSYEDLTIQGGNVSIGSNNNLWTFGTDGRLAFPGTARIDTADNNFEVQAAENINFEANAVVNIYTDTSGTAYQWQFGDDGNLTVPDNGNINGNDGQFVRFQSVEEGIVRSGMILNPGDGLARLESWDSEDNQNFTASDWSSATYATGGPGGEIAFVDAPNIINFINSIETSRVFLQINSGTPVPYDGYSSGGNNITFYTTVAPENSPETVTDFVIYYSTRSRIEMDYDEGELNITARNLDITIDGDQDVDIQSSDRIRIENSSNINGITITTDVANAFHTWTFDVTGNLNLPAGGSISEGPSPSYLGNAVTITPANGGDPNQQLKIYPTVAEGNHLHLTSGNLQVTDVFLGDDNQYIRTTTTGGMIVGTGGGEISGGYAWSFEENGNLIFPDGASIGSGAFNGTASSTVSLNAFSPDGNTVSFQAQGNTSSAVISIFSNAGPITSNWTFTTAPLDPSESFLYVPPGGTITTTNATGGEGGKNIFIQAGASDPETLNSNPGGELFIKGGYGSFGDGGGGPGGNVYIEGGASSDSHAGNVYLTTGLNNWVFDYSGNVTIPGNINAVLSSPAPSINGFTSVNAVTVNASGNISGGNILGNGASMTGVVTKTTGTWTVTSGTNTYSFTVPANGVYQLWVNGNIPNGIIVYNATVSVSNTNVPVIGQQFAWNYEGAGNPITFTSIPAQIIGTAGAISNANPSVGTTTNTFEFGINNSSGNTVTVNYGYTKIS